jgi:signal transduction histidine kinase
MKDLNDRMLRANDELKRVQMQLIQVEKLESLGRLAAGVAHEVKNPLAMLQLGVDYLEGNVASDDPNVPTILGEMREAIVRAEKIIHGMVDFSADRRLNLQQHHINDIIAGAEMLARHELTRHSIRLCHDLAPELPPVFVDGTKIEQVLLNIMMNAIHAMTPQGSGKLLLKSSISRAGTMERDEGARTADHLRGGDSVVIVEVSDSGPGIPADILPKIFDPFFTTKATGEGTGLGLAVVKKIIDLHKGLIKIENRPEGGARVTLTLRAAAPQSGPAQPKPEVSYSI